MRAAVGLYLRLLFAIKSHGATSGLQTPSWEIFRWAMAATTSRQNRVPAPEPEAQPALVLIPGWDFINHDCSLAPSTSFVKDEKIANLGRLQFTAGRTVTAGEEIVMNYGLRPNKDLLLYAGFTLPHNVANVATLSIFLPSDLGRLRALLFQKLIDICLLREPDNFELRSESFALCSASGGERRVEFNIGGRGAVPAPALCAAIAAALTKEECAEFLKNVLESKYAASIDNALISPCAEIIRGQSSETICKIGKILSGAAVSAVETDSDVYSKNIALGIYANMFNNLIEGNIELRMTYTTAVSQYLQDI